MRSCPSSQLSHKLSFESEKCDTVIPRVNSAEILTLSVFI